MTAQLGLAQIAASVGGDKFAAAAPVLDRALKSSPRDSNLPFQRALVSFAQGQARGDTKSAIDELRVAAADRDPQVAQNAAAALRRLSFAP